MSTKRFTVELAPEQDQWVEAEAGRRGVSRRELFRRLVEEARRGGPDQPSQQPIPEASCTPKNSKWRQFLENVAILWNVAPAARAAGVTRSAVYAHLRDDKRFRDAYDTARALYVSRIEQDLVDIGNGLRKGSPVALIAWLNAHHPSWGRVKLELIQRVLGPLIALFVQILREEMGIESDAKITRALERFDAEKTEKLTAFT